MFVLCRAMFVLVATCAIMMAPCFTSPGLLFFSCQMQQRCPGQILCIGHIGPSSTGGSTTEAHWWVLK